MVLQIFRPPGDNELLQDCKLGDINDAISLEYEKYFCGVGTFTLELSPASPFAGAVGVNSLIYSRDDNMCWIVKNTKTAADKMTVTGYDLNGLLRDRLTLPTEDGEAGTEGKDAVSGSTEACVKHFVEYNLISSPMPERNIARLIAAENTDRGIAADSYLASKECLEDVVRTMCGGAGLGYRIRLDLTQSTSEPIFIFDVLEQCDRSADQSERNRVIFSEGMRNIGGIERELGITADKNALWCEVGGLDGFVNSGENVPAGWARREEYVSLSVTDPYNQEFVDEAAQKEMSDKFAPTDSLTVDAGNPLDYGVVYDVGDIVTVYDRGRSVQLNSVISAVTVKRTATEHTVKLILGESKPKLLDGYAKKTDLLSKNQRAYPAAQASSAGAVSSYEYLTNSSVKLNGTTYTIEKNVTGLISKITDSLGNTLKPTISGEITDIALHNAALWGAVMARGIWSSRANPNMLDNSNFKINQRGQSSYTKAGYTVDRWKQESRTKVTMEPDGIRVECIKSTAEPWAGFAQIAEAPFVAGESYTVSVYVTDILGAWRLRSDNAADGVEINLSAGLNVLTFRVVRLVPGSFSNNGININITSETRAGDYFKLQWAKLEVGETATEYTAPAPADELRECQRFYQIHSSGSLSPDELDPPMRATPTVTRLSDGNYAYSADL